MPQKLNDNCNGFYPSLDNQLFIKMIDGCMSVIKGSCTETTMCLNDYQLPIEFYEKKTFRLKSDEEKTVCFEDNGYVNYEVLFFDANPNPFNVNLNPQGNIIRDFIIDGLVSGDFDTSFDQSFYLSYVQFNNPNICLVEGDIIHLKDVSGLLIQTVTVAFVEYITDVAIPYMKVFFNDFIVSAAYFAEIKIPILKAYTNYVYVKTNGSLFSDNEIATFRETNGNDGNHVITTSKDLYNGLKGIIINASFDDNNSTYEDVYLWKHIDSPNWEFGSFLQVLTANYGNFMNAITVKNPTNNTIKFEVLIFV